MPRLLDLLRARLASFASYWDAIEDQGLGLERPRLAHAAGPRQAVGLQTGPTGTRASSLGHGRSQIGHISLGVGRLAAQGHQLRHLGLVDLASSPHGDLMFDVGALCRLALPSTASRCWSSCSQPRLPYNELGAPDPAWPGPAAARSEARSPYRHGPVWPGARLRRPRPRPRLVRRRPDRAPRGGSLAGAEARAIARSHRPRAAGLLARKHPRDAAQVGQKPQQVRLKLFGGVRSCRLPRFRWHCFAMHERREVQLLDHLNHLQAGARDFARAAIAGPLDGMQKPRSAVDRMRQLLMT